MRSFVDDTTGCSLLFAVPCHFCLWRSQLSSTFCFGFVLVEFHAEDVSKITSLCRFCSTCSSGQRWRWPLCWGNKSAQHTCIVSDCIALHRDSLRGGAVLGLWPWATLQCMAPGQTPPPRVLIAARRWVIKSETSLKRSSSESELLHMFRARG